MLSQPVNQPRHAGVWAVAVQLCHPRHVAEELTLAVGVGRCRCADCGAGCLLDGRGGFGLLLVGRELAALVVAVKPGRELGEIAKWDSNMRNCFSRPDLLHRAAMRCQSALKGLD